MKTYSQFRCRWCDESFTVNVEPVLIDEEGNAEPMPGHIDILLESVPCAICGRPLERGDPRNDFTLDEDEEPPE